MCTWEHQALTNSLACFQHASNIVITGLIAGHWQEECSLFEQMTPVNVCTHTKETFKMLRWQINGVFPHTSPPRCKTVYLQQHCENVSCDSGKNSLFKRSSFTPYTEILKLNT